jgi:hypothetical protein
MARVRQAKMNLKRIQDDQAQIAELERRTMAILEHKPFGLPLTAFERKELAMLKEDIAVVGVYGVKANSACRHVRITSGARRRPRPFADSV